MTTQDLCAHLESLGYRPRAYSGRAMYGKQCLGFVPEDNNDQSVIGAVAEIVGMKEDADTREALMDLFQRCSTDRMGLSTIVYFPRMPWEDK